MQHKRTLPARRIGIGLALAALAAGLALLMTVRIPPSQQLIEKELDAKAFLESKS